MPPKTQCYKRQETSKKVGRKGGNNSFTLVSRPWWHGNGSFNWWIFAGFQIVFLGPIPVRGNLDGTATTTQKRDAEEIYHGSKNIFNIQKNLRRSTNYALNTDIPQSYRRSNNTIIVRIFRAMNDTRIIIERICHNYGRPTPQEKGNSGNSCREPCYTAYTRKVFLDRLEGRVYC